MNAITHPVPLYESRLLLALRLVERGRVGAYEPTAPLTVRSADADPWLFSALLILCRDGLVILTDTAAGVDGWRPATLNARGEAVLARWTSRAAPAPRSRGEVMRPRRERTCRP